MNPGPNPLGESHPRRRLLALALLLVLSLSLAAALAWQAIQTSRRHRLTAQHALQDYAGFAAFILASHTYRQLGGAVVAAFAAWPLDSARITPPAGTACAGGTTFLERNPATGAVSLNGAPVDPPVTAFLHDTLQNAPALLQEADWRFRFVHLPVGSADGYFITSYRTRAGKYSIHGFSACLRGPDSPFRQVMLSERALPPAVTGDLPADSLFSVTVAGAWGPPLFGSPVSYFSPYVGTARLGTEFGDLTLRLDLRPDLASRLVIGGVPSSPTPLAIGLLGLSTLLVVMALFQLRREYRLITMRSDFVSNVSHELRTPLSQILIFTELLKLDRLRSKDERTRSLEIIDQEARRLIRLVENVLQFSRVGVRRQRMECEPLPLATVVQETLDAFRPLASSRGVTLCAEVTPSAVVQGNRSALRQVLLNLLDNAVKFGPKGQTVTITTAAENGQTRILVDDQGPGVPLDDRERVWQGYYRLPRESHSAVTGSGIGLAVVRSLVTEMGGRTWIADSDTGGARFVVELTAGNGREPS